MDPGLHVKQALNHLDKVVRYVPFVVEDDKTATVALTPEDWGVVADALFYMDTPRELIPDTIADYRISDDQRAIELTLADGTAVTIEAG